MIIKSRQVYTGLTDQPEPLALLIRGSKIEKVLPYDYESEKGEKREYPTTGVLDEGDYTEEKVIDYGEKLVMSSFIDSHTHVFSGAVDGSDYVCNTLGLCHSEAECVETMKAFAKMHPDQKRLRGTGWFVGAWNDAPLPDKKSLDAAFPDIPVYLRCADGHSMWLNSKAIEEAAYPADFHVDNGEACRYEDGSFTGLFLEPAALQMALDKYMEFTKEELIDIYTSFQDKLASLGICAVSEMSADDYTDENKEKILLFKQLDQEGKLKADIFCYTKLFGYTGFKPFFELRKEMDTAHIHIAGVKGFIDGVTETYTGLLLEPYEDKPETCGDGLPLWPRERMQEEIIAANKAGIQVRLHCIADGSVRMALDMYEKSLKINGDKGLRNTIEHIENIHPDDIDRFKALRVMPSMQPYHVTLSNNGKIWRLGAERCQLEFPIRSIYDAGGEISLGTDYPVVTINPFMTIYAAATRCDDEGHPMCKNYKTQTLPMDVILKAYTKTAAMVYHAEERMGTLEEGKEANIIVLSKNLFTIPVEEIEDTKVQVTYYEGREVYSQESDM